MDSSCVPSGASYLVAFGFGVIAVVLSSWLVLLMRAVYRHDKGFRRGLMNAAPLWVVGFTGFIVLFASGSSLIGWADSCLPADSWSGLGAAFIWLGVAVAAAAVGRLIYNRVRVGTTSEPVDNGGETGSLPSSSDEAPAEKRPRNLPVERRRVIVEYAVTYGAAVIVMVIGAGLAWV